MIFLRLVFLCFMLTSAPEALPAKAESLEVGDYLWEKQNQTDPGVTADRVPTQPYMGRRTPTVSRQDVRRYSRP